MAGGATAQTLGLMSAIFASKKLCKPFKITYFPYSTGTYWPLAIEFLLNSNEIINKEKINKGIKKNQSQEVGKIIAKHPLLSKKISYEHLLMYIRKIKLMSLFLALRRELSSTLNPKKILKLSRFYNTLSGKFPMISVNDVNIELDARFKRANIASPFSKNFNFHSQKFVVIHYRLGDKRASTVTPADFAEDGIIDPIYYKKIVERISDITSMDIYVVSDEPSYAQKILGSVGVNTKIYGNKGNLWDDLYLMSQADIFVGAINSQVTQLANICVENNGGKSHILVPSTYKVFTKFPNTEFFECSYLPKTNKIYTFDFSLEVNSHSAYRRNSKIE